jgi:hypothetical protein
MPGVFLRRLLSGKPAPEQVGPEDRGAGDDDEVKAKRRLPGSRVDLPCPVAESKSQGEEESKAKVSAEEGEKEIGRHRMLGQAVGSLSGHVHKASYRQTFDKLLVQFHDAHDGGRLEIAGVSEDARCIES